MTVDGLTPWIQIWFGNYWLFQWFRKNLTQWLQKINMLIKWRNSCSLDSWAANFSWRYVGTTSISWRIKESRLLIFILNVRIPLMKWSIMEQIDRFWLILRIMKMWLLGIDKVAGLLLFPQAFPETLARNMVSFWMALVINALSSGSKHPWFEKTFWFRDRNGNAKVHNFVVASPLQ